MQDLTMYVDTYIGSVAHLLQATQPAVQSPHGMAVGLPVFRSGVRDVYISDKIFGFTAGSAVIMPKTDAEKPNRDRDASTFDHDFECARPDHYEVLLEDSGICEKHTASKNYGCIAFGFPEDSPCRCAAVRLDGCDKWSVKDGRIRIAKNVGATKPFYYLTLIDSGACRIEEFQSEKALLLHFEERNVQIRYAVSVTDSAELDAFYEAEVRTKTYDDILSECKAAWNAYLGKVRVTGGSESRKRVFYTALYRAACRMQNISVNGRYRGYDGEIHDDGGHAQYINDGIWDTYRGMHPLQLILEPDIHSDILCSYLRMYKESGWLPRFPYYGGNIPCMIGHHTVSLFAEALAKGVPFDLDTAYEAAYKNATERTMLPWTDGEADELTRHYYEHGYLPALEEEEEETCGRVHGFENRQAVAVTIEHSYDDRCVAMLAEKLGKTEDAAYFARRSESYKKLYNRETGFMHPRKADGSFVERYDPKFCGGWGGRKYFAENNAYIYNFAAQHDIAGLTELFGGKETFAEKLDNLFVEQYDGQLKTEFLAQYPDATGLTGQFCMGNEPSFHIPYLYNYCGQAYKTQRKIHELTDLWFTDSPLGICGDEDGGAMSAFLAFSAMGFYPVDPPSGNYDIGSPLFDKIEIDLPNGKVFTVRSEGAAGKAKYIGKAFLNGKELKKPLFSHREMLQGGELTLIMCERPVKECFE